MPTDPTPTDPAATESTATNPTAADSPATDCLAHDPAAGVAGEAEPERRESDASEPASDPERGAVDAEQDADGPEQEPSGTGGDRVVDLECRVTELEAELRAVRGLLDGVGAVDERVERRASAALAKAETLEERLAPEEAGLVRERLPDTAGEPRQEGGEADRTDRRRDGCRTPDADAQAGPPQARSRIRDERDRGAGRRVGETNSPGRDAPASVGAGRTHSADAGAADGGLTESGAISSVGSGAPDGESATTAAEEPDRSLAARLRNAFR